MSFDTTDSFREVSVPALPGAFARRIHPETFAAGTGTLEKLTPVTLNESTGFWQVWGASVLEVTTITANATPATAGNFTLTVNGETTANIAFNATAAAVQTALEALSNVEPGDVVAVATTGANLGVASAVVTLTWGGRFAGTAPTVSITTSGLTGNAHVLAEATAGVADNGTGLIKGFVWPDAIELSATGEVLGNVMHAGDIRYSDIVLPDGEDEDDLKAALRKLRTLDFFIQGLSNFA